MERRIDGGAQLGERLMEVIPAIDIRGGKAVRLFQGDYGRETVFNDSPVDAAQRWLDMGATRLHVVDLDGAKTGEQVNIDLVERIASLSYVPVQLGGAIRTVEAARRAIDVGVDRVIVGTAALEDEEFAGDLRKPDWNGARRWSVSTPVTDMSPFAAGPRKAAPLFTTLSLGWRGRCQPDRLHRHYP